jgi:hypothetical protein
MNMKAPIWNEYITSFSRPPMLSVIVSPNDVVMEFIEAATRATPKPTQPVTLCAIRLPDKYVFKDGELVDIRMRWTHKVYEYVGRDDEWYLLRDYFGGVIGRRREGVLFEGEVAEMTFVVLKAA